jgi:D-glycerate 3-kinase
LQNLHDIILSFSSAWVTCVLQFRGNPGTHDMDLALTTIRSLLGRGLDSTKAGDKQITRIPRYDKTACHGRGDRLPEEAWPLVEGFLECHD